MIMLDSELYFRETADGNLTADEAETTHILDLGEQLVGMGTPRHPLVFWIRVPTVSADDTLACTLHFDNTAALTSPVYTTTFPTISVAGYYEWEFSVYDSATNLRYAGLQLNVTGAAVNLGAVEAGIKDHLSYSRKVQTT
jgi:hypothetical protein